jgi:hypothetical protein
VTKDSDGIAQVPVMQIIKAALTKKGGIQLKASKWEYLTSNPPNKPFSANLINLSVLQ